MEKQSIKPTNRASPDLTSKRVKTGYLSQKQKIYTNAQPHASRAFDDIQTKSIDLKQDSDKK